MGAIKDLVDLVTQLNNSVTDRKFAEELRQVQSMIGSIQSEHAEIHEKRIELMTENADLRQKVVSLEEQIIQLKKDHEAELANSASDVKAELNDYEKEILILLSQIDDATSQSIASRIGQNATKTEFWLDRLSDKELINFTISIGSPSTYYLVQGGREYLVNNDLV